MALNTEGRRGLPSKSARPAPSDHDHSTQPPDDAGPLFSQRTETRGVQTVCVEAAPKPAKAKRASQCDRILAFLSQSHRPRLNQVQATAMGFGVRLPARIDNLRKRGHDIQNDE